MDALEVSAGIHSTHDLRHSIVELITSVVCMSSEAIFERGSRGGFKSLLGLNMMNRFRGQLKLLFDSQSSMSSVDCILDWERLKSLVDDLVSSIVCSHSLSSLGCYYHDIWHRFTDYVRRD